MRVDGWRLVDGAEAWTSGGTIAEARWTGSCATALVLGCSDSTTFRLVAVVIGTVSATPEPGASAETPTSSGNTPAPGASSAATPGASGDFVPTGPAVSCTDLLACLGGTPILIGAGVLAAVLAAGAWLRFGRGRPPALPEKVVPPDLSGGAGPEPPINPLTIDDAGLLDAGSLRADKLPTDKVSVDTADPVQLDPIKLEAGLGPPLESDLPPVPGHPGGPLRP
jgi:hypothetical protein